MTKTPNPLLANRIRQLLASTGGILDGDYCARGLVAVTQTALVPGHLTEYKKLLRPKYWLLVAPNLHWSVDLSLSSGTERMDTCIRTVTLEPKRGVATGAEK